MATGAFPLVGHGGFPRVPAGAIVCVFPGGGCKYLATRKGRLSFRCSTLPCQECTVRWHLPYITTAAAGFLLCLPVSASEPDYLSASYTRHRKGTHYSARKINNLVLQLCTGLDRKWMSGNDYCTRLHCVFHSTLAAILLERHALTGTAYPLITAPACTAVRFLYYPVIPLRELVWDIFIGTPGGRIDYLKAVLPHGMR